MRRYVSERRKLGLAVFLFVIALILAMMKNSMTQQLAEQNPLPAEYKLANMTYPGGGKKMTNQEYGKIETGDFIIDGIKSGDTKPGNAKIKHVKNEVAKQGKTGKESTVKNTTLKTDNKKKITNKDITYKDTTPVINQMLKKNWNLTLSQEDVANLLRIVEAEATGEDLVGKMLVACVVFNRVKSKDFPSTVTKVVFQQQGGTYQFSPIYDGRFYTVTISEGTKQAVAKVIMGEDISNGSLYFMARKWASEKGVAWFDANLDKVLEHGGHEFFK